MESWVATFAFHLFFPDGDFIRAAMSEEGNKSKDKQGKTTRNKYEQVVSNRDGRYSLYLSVPKSICAYKRHPLRVPI